MKQLDARGSRFRGVSTNHLLWQVLVMVYNKMRYVGMIKDEREAARIYDTLAIQYQGDIARTNFPYTKKEVMKILSQRPYFLRGGSK